MASLAQSLSVRTLVGAPGFRWVALGWTGFIAENLVLSENRTKIIQARPFVTLRAAPARSDVPNNEQ